VKRRFSVGFYEIRRAAVVLLWSIRGGMRGKSWYFDGHFSTLKNTPQSSTLF
jgi:hypothetical protein